MGLLGLYRTFGPHDLRNVGRETLLWAVALVPIAAALILRWAVPALEAPLASGYGVSLAPYHVLIASGFLLMTPGLVGMVTGFLLLDERDEGVLAALAVTPLAPSTYLAYRVSAPALLALLMTLAGYRLLGVTPLPWSDVLAAALVAALAAPGTALFLAAFAENKVSGFAFVKVLNTINMVPVFAFFVAEPWQWLAGVVPSYWPMKILWLAADGRAYGLALVIGLAVNAGVVWILLRAFERRGAAMRA